MSKTMDGKRKELLEKLEGFRKASGNKVTLEKMSTEQLENLAKALTHTEPIRRFLSQFDEKQRQKLFQIGQQVLFRHFKM
ncbi:MULTISPECIES: hypothetical protein [Bacillus]|uniref:Uncharacterized protein n=1 Tax=Bacillus glycinifermentans TaxID=1664069 RepID=A0AAJ4D3D7_9BACI|nr:MULTISPECIES: hypothetical protein [Bacillus]MDU0070054.1 hypothetical protein [Bacillus sp. IG6]MED8017727.1 hypothetical protein [Bacillus glycinifermentans]QAT66390.1 hypothetical protein EQZ20_16785 [Bacillus glycinifermentans]